MLWLCFSLVLLSYAIIKCSCWRWYTIEPTFSPITYNDLDRNLTKCPSQEYYYVTVMDSSVYMMWQTELQMHNFRCLDILSKLIVVCLYPPTDGLATRAKRLISLHTYPENIYYFKNRDSVSYVATNKAYGLFLLSKARPDLKHIFVQDPDVIYKRPLPLQQFLCCYPSVQGSDTANYLGYDHYLKDKGVSKNELETICQEANTNCDLYAKMKTVPGAQYFYHHIPTEIFLDMVNYCDSIETALRTLALHRPQVKPWVGEMLAQLFAIIQFVKPTDITCPRMLDFAWASHRDLVAYNDTNILHMAGVENNQSGLFYKGQYTSKPPWLMNDDDKKYITHPDGPHLIYLRLIEDYKQWLLANDKWDNIY